MILFLNHLSVYVVICIIQTEYGSEMSIIMKKGIAGGLGIQGKIEIDSAWGRGDRYICTERDIQI